ncbi:MAG: hypothetical protein JW754_03745, partial [Candidatus Aenigmarchaeota archaeon]|nr:hypothetical protein [Candidatus Aenigmarchaeota archaeon]
CDVWAGNFSCLDSDGQGAMILGYWKAFEQEGTDSYLDIANNISSAGLSYPDSDYLSLAYWKAFEMTGNDTYRQKALNITENRKNECNGNCTVINQSLNILSLLEAYEQTGNSSYKDTGLNRSFNFSDCDPFGGSYSCPRPIDQGSAINVFWELFRMTETGGVLNASLTYNLERSVYLGEEINITCSVNNTGFFPAQDVEVTINVTGGLNITQNLTKYATNISADNYMDFTWNATAVELGEQSIMCSVTSNVGGLDVFANVTIVSQPSGEPPGAPGPSSGPPIGIAAPTKKLEIEGMPTSVNLYFGRDETITFFLKNTGEKNLTISGFTWDSDQVDLSMYPLYFSLDSGKMAEVTLTLRQLNQIYTELPLEITIITEEDYEKKTQIRLFILSCVPYDVTCENGVMRSCDEYGFGFEETYCEQGCDGNGCLVRICEPDTSTCAGGVLTECSSDGKEQWINECENGCSETGDRCLVAKMGISPANIFFLSVIFYCFFILSSMGALFSGRYYMKYGRVTYYSVGDYLQRRIRNLVERNKSDKLFEIHKLLEELYMKTEKDHPKSKTIEKQMSEMKRVLETFVILEVMEDKKREMKILPKDIQKLKTNFADTTAKIKDDEIRNKFEKRFKKMGL